MSQSLMPILSVQQPYRYAMFNYCPSGDPDESVPYANFECPAALQVWFVNNTIEPKHFPGTMPIYTIFWRKNNIEDSKLDMNSKTGYRSISLDNGSSGSS